MKSKNYNDLVYIVKQMNDTYLVVYYDDNKINADLLSFENLKNFIDTNVINNNNRILTNDKYIYDLYKGKFVNKILYEKNNAYLSLLLKLEYMFTNMDKINNVEFITI